MWASQAQYQGVFLWPSNSSASQRFDLLDSGRGYFRIRARHSGQCLMPDWRTGSYTNGTPIVQHGGACVASYKPAEWRWVDVNRRDGTHRPDPGSVFTEKILVNRMTGKCLDAGNSAGSRPPVQAILQQCSDDWNADNQLWRDWY